MRYLPHTEDEIREMLRVIRAPSVDALFNAIPDDRRFKRPLDLEPTLDEATLMGHLTELARKNEGARYVSFLGAGMYDHHIPPAVDQLLLRSEFYTAYTPYQPELSQGTLQSIFEFQTIVCQLFGMEIANASMYDGASAAAEAVLMARRLRGTTHAVVSGALHPHYIETIRAYLTGADETPHITVVPADANGRTDLAALDAAITDKTACVIVGYPNFFGVVEDLRAVREISAKKGALAITATAEAYALALLEAPGVLGFDIAVGEGQSLAVPAQFGGPGVGLFACSQKHLRQMPGRLCGETIDANGKRGFVLTLSTREQHIRRERATSNICTNHGLIALAMLMRTAMLGKSGFDSAARICLSRAEYLKKKLVATGKVTLPYAAPTFDEFVVRRKSGTAAELLTALEKEGILGGVDLGTFDPAWKSDLLVAVTEKRTPAELDALAAAIARLG
jgi:glycine dehydrogenase subunit 1